MPPLAILAILASLRPAFALSENFGTLVLKFWNSANLGL